MNCGSGSFIFIKVEEFYVHKIIVAEEVLVNCYNINEPESQFGFAAPWSQCLKKYFRLHVIVVIFTLVHW
jgi:hypothetical protein